MKENVISLPSSCQNCAILIRCDTQKKNCSSKYSCLWPRPSEEIQNWSRATCSQNGFHSKLAAEERRPSQHAGVISGGMQAGRCGHSPVPAPCLLCGRFPGSACRPEVPPHLAGQELFWKSFFIVLQMTVGCVNWRIFILLCKSAIRLWFVCALFVLILFSGWKMRSVSELLVVRYSDVHWSAAGSHCRTAKEAEACIL